MLVGLGVGLSMSTDMPEMEDPQSYSDGVISLSPSVLLWSFPLVLFPRVWRVLLVVVWSRLRAACVRGGGVDAVLCMVFGPRVLKSCVLPVAGVFVAVTLGPGPWR